VAWQESVFDLYLSEGKIEPEVMENMRSWEHSGFSVDQSVLLAAGDRSGIERVVQYMVRCPFSLSRLVKIRSRLLSKSPMHVGTEPVRTSRSIKQ